MDSFPKGVRIWIIPRSGGNATQIPKDVQLWFQDGAGQWTDAGVCHFRQPATDKDKTYMEQEVDGQQDIIYVPEGTKVICFENIQSQRGEVFFSLSEMGIEEVVFDLFDAEAEAKKVIEANKAGH